MQDKYKKWLNAAVLLILAAWLAKPYLIKDKPEAGKPKAAVSKVDNSRLLGSIRFTPCTLAKGADSLMAYCGTLQVPENHDAPDGRKITLAISWLPASGEAEPDPIFMLAGGPGQAASFLGPFAAALTGVRKDRDIVLVDQRGPDTATEEWCSRNGVADLVTDGPIERLPDPDAAVIDGVVVPRIQVAPFEVSAAAKVRLAAKKHAPQDNTT